MGSPSAVVSFIKTKVPNASVGASHCLPVVVVVVIVVVALVVVPCVVVVIGHVKFIGVVDGRTVVVAATVVFVVVVVAFT
jgi:hypothetical protein